MIELKLLKSSTQGDAVERIRALKEALPKKEEKYWPIVVLMVVIFMAMVIMAAVVGFNSFFPCYFYI